MDLILYLIAILVLGGIRSMATGGNAHEDESTLAPDGSLIPPKNTVPVGDNLYMLKEEGAFTAILQELGLIR